MSTIERFNVALAASAVDLPGPELMPERLASAPSSPRPAFYDDLVTRTSIPNIIAPPLEDESRGFGALDLYVVPPGDVGSVTGVHALTVAREVVRSFRATRREASVQAGGRRGWTLRPLSVGTWSGRPWGSSTPGSGSPALALLRAYAYSEGMDLDDLAARVLDRDVSLHLLALDADPSRLDVGHPAPDRRHRPPVSTTVLIGIDADDASG